MNDNDLFQATDDLKLIPGIGSGVEARLNAAGIHTFAQLAAQSPEALVDALKGMVGITPARIARQGWIEQAGKLAEAAEAELDTRSAVSSRQYYETFTVELLVAEDHTIRRTRVARVQDAVQDSWAGFHPDKLVAFFARSAGLDLPQPSSVFELQPEKSDVKQAAGEIVPVIETHAELTGIDLLSGATQRSTQMLLNAQPFEVLLKIELPSQLADSATADVPYQARIIARQLGSHKEHMLCSVEDRMNPRSGGELKLKAAGLPAGVYRVFADLNLSLPGSQEQLTGEGSLLQVY
jgi:hypothetical protein